MQQWYLARTFFKLDAPDTTSEADLLRSFIAKHFQCTVGSLLGKGWFEAITFPPRPELTEVIVAAGACRSVTHPRQLLLALRSIHDVVSIFANTGGKLTFVDQFSLPILNPCPTCGFDLRDCFDSCPDCGTRRPDST